MTFDPNSFRPITDPELTATEIDGPGPDPITDRAGGLTSGQEPDAYVLNDYLRHLDANNFPKINDGLLDTIIGELVINPDPFLFPKITSADNKIIHDNPVTTPTDGTPFPDNLTRALLELEAAYGYSPEDKIPDKSWKEIIRDKKVDDKFRSDGGPELGETE